MITCKHCGSEIAEQKVKTRILNGVEYEIETHDFNKTLSEIIIPKGWRLWRVSDFEKMPKEAFEKLNLKDSWFFIEQPLRFQKSKYVAGFVAGSDGAYMGCGWDPADRDPSLGVRFCRDLKVKNEVKNEKH